MKRSDDFQRVRERLEARRGFFAHLAVFVVVNTALVVINLTTASDYLWAK
ncbi:MAG: 2TM domain-containing protein [Gemmatimonadota bacterium]|nr:2TM domain-containing protein [Gemmatimonadota bacterium]MDH3423992.1 2TM domain-containing protein [Gemmatimonadota bacterium]